MIFKNYAEKRIMIELKINSWDLITGKSIAFIFNHNDNSSSRHDRCLEAILT